MKLRFVLLIVAAITLIPIASAFAQVRVVATAPANNSTGLMSPVHITANAYSNLAATGWRIYVDGVSVYQYSGPWKALNQWVNMKAGTHKVVLRCWASNGTYGSAYLTLTVGSPATVTPLQITTTTLPAATQNATYSAGLTARGGTAPYTWSVVSGQLPAGLQMSTPGVISGTPTASGTATFSVTVKDSASSPQAATTSMTLTVNTAQIKYLWQGTMETGDMTQWYYPSTSATGSYGGGIYNSGIASAYATTEKAHSGNWSAKLNITTPSSPTSGTRLFRWQEGHSNRALYYSVWVYVPANYTRTANFWNLFQFKSSNADKSRNDPVWAFYVNSTANGLYISAGWGAGGTTLAGPRATDGVGIKSYTQSIAPLPVGRWVHLQSYLRQSNAFDGQVTLWIDGVKVFDFQNVRTSYYNCNYSSWCADNAWAVNLYSDGLTPNPAYMYVDDAAIATTYIP
ncbi:MAG: heparin lyase I family protein [Terriglobales bacterium]